MAHSTANRVATIFVVLTLLVALSFAMDPIFGRPETSCMLPPSNLLALFLPGCQ
jgi:hypothetical protein